jgi:hypothetical protein
MLPLAIAVQLLAVPPGAPRSSADVVRTEFARHSIADGLESFFVTLKVERGWHVYAAPASAREREKEDARAGITTDAARGVRFEFLLDGRAATVVDVWHPPGVVKSARDGTKYRAHEGNSSFTVLLIWDDTKDAKVLTAKVKLVATDGKRQLKESVLTAETR